MDGSRAAISGVQVVVRNSQTGLERRAVTNDAGQFSVAALPIGGAYSVAASKSGFAEGQASGLTLAGGATATVTLELAVAGGQTQVTVTGVAGEVRTDEPQLGVRIDAAQAEEIPLFNRRLTALPLLNAANRPAINQGDIFMNQNLFTTNGAGRRQTWFEIDGSTGNDSWGRQTTFSTLPLMSLQEMTVLSNAFSAEYGGSTGSVVNIVTKSGDDRLPRRSAGAMASRRNSGRALRVSLPQPRPPATRSPATRWDSRRSDFRDRSAAGHFFRVAANSAGRTAARR